MLLLFFWKKLFFVKKLLLINSYKTIIYLAILTVNTFLTIKQMAMCLIK